MTIVPGQIGHIAEHNAIRAELDAAPSTYSAQDKMAANARNYGAVGDGISRPLSTVFSTLVDAQAVYPTAIALTDELDWAAITTCIAARGGVYLPDTGNEYVINRPIALTTGRWIQGDPRRTAIRQTANNTQVLMVYGTVNVQMLRMDYSRQQTSSETSSNGIEMYNVNGGSTLRNLSIRRAARSIYNASNGYTFSTSFVDLDISGFSISGIHITNNGGITGNVFQNVYVHNNYDGTRTSSTLAPVVIQGWDDGVFNQLNIEHSIAPQAMTINQAWNLTINGMHLEGFEMTGNFGGLIELVGTFADRVHISGLTVLSCVFTPENIPSGISALFKLTNSTFVEVVGLSLRGNLSTIANLALVYVAVGGSSGSATANFRHVVRDGTWLDTVGDSTKLPVVRSYNTDDKYTTKAGKLEVGGTAAPTANTWAVGDKVIRTTPVQGGNLGWVCVTAGTPGTWVEYGAVGDLTETIRLDAGALGPLSTGPSLGPLAAGTWLGWSLDATTAEYIGGQVNLPASWVTFDILVEAVNNGAGAGAYCLRPLYGFRGTGDDISASMTTGSIATTTAAAQNVLQVVTVATGITKTAGKTFHVRIDRRAAEAGDTLANDLGVSAIILRRAS